MQLNPDSHMFEESDLNLLRGLKDQALTAPELWFAEMTDSKTLPEIAQRMRFLIKMDMAEVCGYDLANHRSIYAITDVGRRFIDVINRMCDKQEIQRRTHLIAEQNDDTGFNLAAEEAAEQQRQAARYKEQPSFENFLNTGGARQLRPTRQPRSSKSKPCMWCGGDAGEAAWCSNLCFDADSKRYDCTFLWSCGIRVDDDLFAVIGSVHEREKQNRARHHQAEESGPLN